MEIKDPTVQRDIQTGAVTVDDLARHLLNAYSAPALARELAQYVIDEERMKPVRLSLQELRNHFKVIGFKWDQEGNLVPENRGSNRWKKEM